MKSLWDCHSVTLRESPPCLAEEGRRRAESRGGMTGLTHGCGANSLGGGSGWPSQTSLPSSLRGRLGLSSLARGESQDH